MAAISPAWKRLRIGRRDAIFFTVLAIVLLLGASTNFLSKTASADDFAFGSETVTKGTTANAANRNANDGSFETLTEADQYADTNFSGTTETITKGTASGAAFPGAFDTDDASRRSYQEVNNAPIGYTQFLNPTSDYRKQWTVYPASPTTEWDKMDDAGTADLGDSATTYIYATATGNSAVMGMADMTTPSAGYSIAVTIYAVVSKASSSACNIKAGLRIGTTEYYGVNVAPTTSYVNQTYAWATNPATAVAWTYTDVNNLQTCLNTTDASPNPYCTKLVLKIVVTYAAQYTADVNIEYTNVVSDGQTASYMVYCQGYRSSTENFIVYAWDYVAVGWSTAKATIAAASDTDYNFALATNERDAVNNKVKLRILDATTTDTAQDTVTFDVLKVNAIKKGYALDVSMTASTVAQYGNVSLRFGGKCSNSENFYVTLWNYTTSGWDPTAITVTGGTNTLYHMDLYEPSQRSTQEVKIRVTDATAQTADQVQDTLSLDWAAVTLWHVDPTSSNYASTNNGDGGENTDIYIWATYTDADNEAPEYMRVYWGANLYDMTKNNSGDTTYYNGCDYYYHVGTASPGSYLMQLRFKDANSAEKFQTIDTFVVHPNPTLSQTGVTPATGNNGQTFTWFTTYDMSLGEYPDYVKIDIAGTEYAMLRNDTGDYTPPIAYYYSKTMAGGTWSWHIHYKAPWSVDLSTAPANLVVNNGPSLADKSILPAAPRYKNTLLNVTTTVTDVDNDPMTAVWFKATSGGSWNYSMSEVDHTDTITSDGKAYYWTGYLDHGTYNTKVGATDGKMAGYDTQSQIVIANRAPSISNKVDDFSYYRNTYWEHDYTATDPDDDSLTWSRQLGPTWLSIDSVTGICSGTTPNAPGGYTFIFKVSDGYAGGTDSDPFAITVTNRAPSITNGPGASVNEWRNTTWHYVFAYSDADGDGVTWQRSGPSWLNISSGGNLSGTTTNTPGSYSFTVWANDSYGGSANYAFTLHVLNRAPSVTDRCSSNPTAYRNVAWSFDFNGTDADTDTISWARSGPSWLTISSSTGVLSGTTTNAPGNYGFTVYANDSYSGSDSYSFTLTLQNIVPQITSSGNTTQLENTHLAYHIAATDADGDSLSYALSTDAGWASLSNTWINGTAIGITSYSFDVWVNDSYSGSAHEHFTLTVTSNNHAPSFTSSPINSVANNSFYSYDANATDPDLDTLTFGLSSDNGYLGIDSGTGLVSGTPHHYGDFYVHISVSDSINPLIWQNFTWHVTSAAPHFTSTPIYVWPNNTGFEYDVNAVDPEGEPLYYDVFGDISALGFCTINHTSGQITGEPHLIGHFSANVSIRDGGGNIVWQNWSMQVYSDNPVIQTTPIETWQNGTTYWYELTAEDPENEPLIWSVEGNCTSFVTINPATGRLSNITGPVTHMGWWNVHVSVWDGFNRVWQNFTLTALNTAPLFTSTPIDTAELNVSYSYYASANDLNNDTLQYAIAEGPTWMFIDNATGEIGGTPNGYGVWSVSLTVFDGHAYAWQNYTLTCAPPYVPPIPPPAQPDMLGTGMVLGMSVFALVIVLAMMKRGQGETSDDKKAARGRK